MSLPGKAKKVLFQSTDIRHAELKIRLRHDGLSQKAFFNSIVEGYLSGDRNISCFIEKVKEQKSKLSLRSRSKVLADVETGLQTKEEFFSSMEKEKMFDTILEEKEIIE